MTICDTVSNPAEKLVTKKDCNRLDLAYAHGGYENTWRWRIVLQNDTLLLPAMEYGCGIFSICPYTSVKSDDTLVQTIIEADAVDTYENIYRQSVKNILGVESYVIHNRLIDLISVVELTSTETIDEKAGKEALLKTLAKNRDSIESWNLKHRITKRVEELVQYSMIDKIEIM